LQLHYSAQRRIHLPKQILQDERPGGSFLNNIEKIIVGIKTMRILILLLGVIALQSCTSDPMKYELKSPCVSADSDSAAAPCTRRPIAGNQLG